MQNIVKFTMIQWDFRQHILINLLKNVCNLRDSIPKMS